MTEKVLEVASTQVDLLQLLERVETFYNNAWGKLVIFVTITVAFAGILLPLLLQYLQRKSLNLEAEKLKAELQKDIVNSVSSIKDEIVGMFQKKSEELESEMEKKIIGFHAETSRLHATQNENLGNWEASALWWSRAIRGYHKAEEEELVSVAVSSLRRTIEKCESMTKKSKEEIKNYLPMIPKTLWFDKGSIEKKLTEIKDA